MSFLLWKIVKVFCSVVPNLCSVTSSTVAQEDSIYNAIGITWNPQTSLNPKDGMFWKRSNEEFLINIALIWIWGRKKLLHFKSIHFQKFQYSSLLKVPQNVVHFVIYKHTQEDVFYRYLETPGHSFRNGFHSKLVTGIQTLFRWICKINF